MKKITPPSYLLIFILLILVSHYTIPLRQLFEPPFSYLGVVFILFGLWFNLWTDRLFRVEETTVKPFQEPSVLITRGPFGLTRHPMYLGMLAIIFGEAVLLGSLVCFLFPLGFFVLIENLFVLKEEENLHDKFGSEYSDYTDKVRRWL